STYVLWTLTHNHGWPYWPAAAFTLAVSFAGGVGIHQLAIRPVERGSVLQVVIVTIGLLLTLNGLVTWIWGGSKQTLQSPFPTRTGDVAGGVGAGRDLATIGVSVGIVVAL